jgi:hypothetical protein
MTLAEQTGEGHPQLARPELVIYSDIDVDLSRSSKSACWLRSAGSVWPRSWPAQITARPNIPLAGDGVTTHEFSKRRPSARP